MKGKCIICNKEFIKHNNNQKTCSIPCSKILYKKDKVNWRLKQKKPIKICQFCGKDITLLKGAIKYCLNCRKIHIKQYQSMRAFENKILVFNYYGGSPPRCACCGETTLSFLTIDHIKGRNISNDKKHGNSLYAYLIRNNYPKGFQILCYNCNCVKTNHKTRFCYVHHPRISVLN